LTSDDGQVSSLRQLERRRTLFFFGFCFFTILSFIYTTWFFYLTYEAGFKLDLSFWGRLYVLLFFIFDAVLSLVRFRRASRLLRKQKGLES